MPFFIDTYCDTIAHRYSSTIITYCFGDLHELGVNREGFIKAFWKRYPQGSGNTGTNFLKFGLEHNEVFNIRLGRPEGHPTFQEYIKRCLAPMVARMKSSIDKE